MTKLTDLPNVGKTLEKRLNAAGITTPEQLTELGAREAFFRINLIEGDACLCTLCALEGAVEGIRWHDLSPEKKAALKDYHDTFGHHR